MKGIKEIPREKTVDNTLTLLSEGYEFISNRRKQFNSDIFQTRLLGQKVICMTGEEAGRAFYDEDRFIRKPAIPMRIQKSLFGKNGVQTLDEKEHRHRKGMFMSIMTHQSLDKLQEITKKQWTSVIPKWEKNKKVILMEEAKQVLYRIACEWAGVPLKEKEVKKRAEEMFNLVDSIGGVGPRYQKGRWARRDSDKWVADIIGQVRDGKLSAEPGTALSIIANHRDLTGELLELELAAVELINIIRPVVANCYFVVFCAIAMHDYPEVRKLLKTNNEVYNKMFVQEVRRYYPFAPFLGARVRKDFYWNEYPFKKGTLVLLDLYGTNHHPDLWDDPDTFKVERFREWKDSPFAFIPQGGGDYDKGHRCAGEWATVKILQTTVDFLVKDIDYEVPEQDLAISKTRIPTYPKSGFIIQNVKST